MCLFGLKSRDKEDQQKILDDVVGEELCGVACCRGSGIVVWTYSPIQHLMREIKEQKHMRFFV